MRFAAILTTCILTTVAGAAAEWQPPNLVAATATLTDVLAANERVSGNGDARFAQRRERWTYAAGDRRIAVTVAVRDDDFRTTLEVDGLTYSAGRIGGARWRGDGNGIVHGIEADLVSVVVVIVVGLCKHTDAFRV